MNIFPGSPDPDQSPIHSNGRLADPVFENDELLYRRFDPKRFLLNGILSPLAFNFPRQSVNRGKFSVPGDVLEPDCCDGIQLTGWQVVALLVGDMPQRLISGDNREFHFFLRHMPVPRCYAHSEMWCNQGGPDVEVYDEPPKKVRDEFRMTLARKCAIVAA